ncbi:MAG: 4Fe-4S dicluster domain-containing protein [Planctomycetota bacterium]
MNKPNNKTFDFSRPETVDNDSSLKESVDRDFGAATDALADGVSRRRWLQLMGASLALGGAAGCRYQEETIAPFAFRPQNRIPGVPQKFATMLDFDGVAQPILANCYDGRPIKLDGNPYHPFTANPDAKPLLEGGDELPPVASTSYTQARILELYDPDRLREPMRMEDGVLVPATREEADQSLEFLRRGSLDGVAVLSGPSSSPTVHRLKQEIEGRGGSWFTFASISDDNSRAGSRLAFGRTLRPHYLLEKANVIITIDSDLLHADPAGDANSARFVRGRDVDHSDHMSRMYTVESQYSTTGGMADHRMSLRSSDIPKFVAALSEAVEAGEGGIDSGSPYREKFFQAMVDDLLKDENRGHSVIVCGERQPPEVHATVHKLNEMLGNHGETIVFTEPIDADRAPMLEAITTFADQVESGAIKSLVIVEGNPVYDAPRELGLEEAIKSLSDAVHLTLSKNETSMCCQMLTDVAHGLEAWGDGQAYDGTVCVSQPLVRPLFGSPSVIELLAGIAGQEIEVSETDLKRGRIPVPGMDLVKETIGVDGDAWGQSVQDGFVADSAADLVTASCGEVASLECGTDWNVEWDSSSLEVVFTPSSSLWDGRFANNAWLQELPDFFTKITWGNAALMNPKTASALGCVGEKLATVKVGDNSIQLPVCVIPGMADGSVGIALGYGRMVAGRVGGNLEGADVVGVDAGEVRSADAWYVADDVDVDPSGTTYRLATTQERWNFDELGTSEIQNRMFRNPAKSETDRSSLIREGSFASYSEYKANHDHGDHDHEGDGNHGHDDEGADGHSSTRPSFQFDRETGALPVLNNVALVTPLASEEDGGHGHAEKHSWPEAFHMHHALFDITPGAREMYKFDEGDPNIAAWGMSIDLNKCTGCNACVIACQAENNIPVVGKSQVMKGRELHWLRIDRYFGSNLYNDEASETDDQQVAIQPMTCHHCENAPCETVCPVAATVHSHEGLNDMVYNRCIGTRYCGNNCPYKVRRFNYFNYSDAVTLIKYPGADKLPAGDRALQNLMMNPEVTIRSRGVMEKCTYCTQRISAARIKSRAEGREIGANEITVACQDACATSAIQFGNLHNPENTAAQAHNSSRAYVLLEELNNRPRTKYLARVRNVHPELTDHDDRDSVGGGHGGHGGDSHDDEHHGEESHADDNHRDESHSDENHGGGDSEGGDQTHE